MEQRGGNSIEWIKFIIKEKENMIEKRPWIMSVLKQQATIEKKLNRFKKIYPYFRTGEIYFCLGINNSGGTINDNTVYIETEVVSSKVIIGLYQLFYTNLPTLNNGHREI